MLNLYSSWLRVKTEKVLVNTRNTLNDDAKKMYQNSSRKWCQRHGVEEQRLYELVKLKEQFGSILKGLRGSDETGNDDDEFSSSKKRKEPDTEQDYWMDPEYKRKREQRFQLVQQKHKQTSTKRKMLKFQEFEYATGEDGMAIQDSVNDNSSHC